MFSLDMAFSSILTFSFFSRMYWSDIGSFEIFSAYMNGTGLEIVASDVLVYGLALDHLGKPQSHIHDFGPGRATVRPDLASR